MDDFVTFEIAKKLKEKGFNEPCINAVNRFGCSYLNGWCEYLDDRDDEFITQNDLKDDCYLLPTISQVLKWLREEKGYHIEFIGNACGYLFIVSDIPSKGGTDRHCSDYDGPNDGGTWDTYEEAALAGIEYVLDNLI